MNTIPPLPGSLAGGPGASLLRAALARTVQEAEIARIRALVVHAISADAKRFYRYFGFREASSEPLTLMATLGDLRAALKSGEST